MPDMILPDASMPERKATVPMTAHGKPRVREPRANEGRPTFIPSAAQRQMVLVWRGTGIAPADIARQVGVSLATLNKHFHEEMAHGMTTIISKMSAKVVTKALGGDGAMLKFYLANFGGDLWKEKKQLELTGKDGAPLDPPNLIVSFLPMPAIADESA